MSVVNKMLQDLESRERKKALGANYVPEKSYRPTIVVIVLLIISFAVAATYTVNVVMKHDIVEPTKEALKSDKEIKPGDKYASTESAQKTSDGQKHTQAKPNPIDLTKIANTSAFRNSVVDEALPNIGSIANENTQHDVNNNAHNNNSHNTEQNALNNDVMAKNTEQMRVNRANTENNNPDYVFSVKPSNGGKTQLSNLRAKAHIASKQGNGELVIENLRNILVISPKDTRTRKQLAALLFSKARLKEASAVLETGLNVEPTESSLRLMLARTYYKSGSKAAAFDVLSKHPYQTLASDELLSFRAALAEKLGNYANAELDYEMLVKRNPSEAKWWLGLGVAQDKQKLAAQAINSYQQAKALNQLPQQVDNFVTQRIQHLARES